MTLLRLSVSIVTSLLLTAPLMALPTTGQGKAIVTVLADHPDAPTTPLTAKNLSLKIDRKDAPITSFAAIDPAENPLEIVLLIDSGASSSLGTQWGEIEKFAHEIPSHSRMAIAYMQNGRAVMGAPLSDDPKQILASLHIPSGPAGSSASPYFCLSDLAKNWPSKDLKARRVVLMITDGVDNYHPQYDPDDPYVQSSIRDSVEAGLQVYSIYWQNRGRGHRFGDTGQSLLLQVADSTGGRSYYIGSGNPVTFSSYFEDLRRRLRSQYQLRFTAPLNGKPETQSLKLKSNLPHSKPEVQQLVFVDHTIAE
jgi:hypothetical protein